MRLKISFLLFWLMIGALPAATLNTFVLTTTNATANGDSFTVGASTITFTSAPLNAITWIATGSTKVNATNVSRRLGSQFPQYFSQRTTETNVTIWGPGLDFSISGGWGFVTTNTPLPLTNNWFLALPFENQFDTNRTNNADQLIFGIGKYALTSSFPANASALTANFVGLTNQQTLTRKALTSPIINGGTNNATHLTNIPTLGASNATIQQLNANVGTLEGFIGTNFVRLNVNLAVITNLLALQTVASNVTLQRIVGAWGNLGNLTNGALYGTTLGNVVGSLVAPLIYNTGEEGVGSVFTITNNGGNPGIVFDNSDVENGGAGMVFKFGGVTYWAISSSTNDFNIGSEAAGTLIGLQSGIVTIGSIGNVIQFGTNAYGNLLRVGILQATNIVGSNYVSHRFAFKGGAYASLVNGNNASIPTGTNAFLDLSGGTTIAQIAGFAATGEGDEFEARFTGATTNWIVNKANSIFSTDAVAANRINTGTGGDITLTNQPAWARFRHNGTEWELKSFSR